MSIKFNFILIVAITLSSCNDRLTKIDFKSLPIEYMNSIENADMNRYKFKPLPPEYIISSSTNRVNLSSDLLEWSDSLLIDLGKPANSDAVTDDWEKFCTYTLGIITNEQRFKTIEIALDNSESDVLHIEHVATEFAIKDYEYIQEKSFYRYPCIMKYHFKMCLNKKNERCEGMKHLVYLDDYLIYSPTKLK